jgi:hypothetical protein
MKSKVMCIDWYVGTCLFVCQGELMWVLTVDGGAGDLGDGGRSLDDCGGDVAADLDLAFADPDLSGAEADTGGTDTALDVVAVEVVDALDEVSVAEKDKLSVFSNFRMK